MESRYARIWDLNFSNWLLIWKEQAPVVEKKYLNFRWGKDLQIWVVGVRDYRSENNKPDGADKSIWGKEQIDWFRGTL